MLLFHNYQHVLKFKKLQTAKTVYGMIAAAGYKNWCVASIRYSSNRGMIISFIEDSRMKELNSKYRHKDSSTDILSFPAYKVRSVLTLEW